MEFKVEEARELSIKTISNKLGETKVNNIIKAIKQAAKEGKTTASISIRKMWAFGDDEYTNTVLWCRLNGYDTKVSDGNIIISWD